MILRPTARSTPGLRQRQARDQNAVLRYPTRASEFYQPSSRSLRLRLCADQLSNAAAAERTCSAKPLENGHDNDKATPLQTVLWVETLIRAVCSHCIGEFCALPGVRTSERLVWPRANTVFLLFDRGSGTPFRLGGFEPHLRSNHYTQRVRGGGLVIFSVFPIQGSFRRVVVAIPARDEVERLPACIDALANQVDKLGRPLRNFGVVVFANNCTDDTARVARQAALQVRFDLRVVEQRLPRAISHAGGARRAAMDLAVDWLAEHSGEDGVLLTTDADSRVARDWIATNLAAFDEGADAVLGRIALDEEGKLLPPALHVRGKFEAVYEDLLAEISARLDPQECNRWPYHSTISGASVGLTQEFYRRVGGLPRAPLGEEKALVTALRRLDARIRFAPDVFVTTSGRTVGRAPGGSADTLRLRSHNVQAPCDEALELCSVAYKRALWRGRLRRLGYMKTAKWRLTLGLSDATARDAQAASTFGAAWEIIERSSPALRRRLLTPSELPREIARARRLLGRLEEKLSAPQHVEPVFGASIAAGALDTIL